MNENFVLSLDTFLFRREWADVFLNLSDEKAGILVKAIYNYTAGNEVTPEDPEIATFYKLMTKQLNNSARRYLARGSVPSYNTN